MGVSDGGWVLGVLSSPWAEPNENISNSWDESGTDGFRGV